MKKSKNWETSKLEEQRCLKLMEFSLAHHAPGDILLAIKNLSIFFSRQLGAQGIIVLRRFSGGEQEVILSQSLWKHYGPLFKRSQALGGWGREHFTFFKQADEHFALLEIYPDEQTLLTLIVPLGDTEGNCWGLFFSYLKKYLDNIVGLARAQKRLQSYQDLVFRDDTTLLLNQRKLLSDLDQCIAHYEADGKDFFVYFIDIDHFKEINDLHGHLTGSSILRQVGELLKSDLRETDQVYRYGGDEMVAIVRHVDFEEACRVGERILKSLREHTFEGHYSFKGPCDIHITASIGMAGFPEDASTKEEILFLADKMMYESKSFQQDQFKLISGREA